MRFGIFDHVDRSDRPFARQLDERLEYVAAADALGFYCYHVAEHHATPLNMVPVPGVYLGAVARASERMRLGPLVYLLPLYSPLRLIEEIGILDHLSHGRLDLGVGRGVSAYELNYHKIDPETSRTVFQEALEVLRAGFANERLTHHGTYFDYENVPMELRPLQKPHPPIWYPSSSEVGSAWAGAQGFNFCTLGGVDRAKTMIERYREAYAKRNGPASPGDFPGGTAIGVNRYTLVAETDEEAARIAQPAYDRWYANLTKLERENVSGPRFASAMAGDVREAAKTGQILVGSPETVREEVERQIEVLGLNYIVTGFYFGTLGHEHAMRSMRLYAEEVAAKLAHK